MTSLSIFSDISSLPARTIGPCRAINLCTTLLSPTLLTGSVHPQATHDITNLLLDCLQHKTSSLRTGGSGAVIGLNLILYCKFDFQVNEESFKPSIAWLDDFMRRFCLSKKKTGFYSKSMLKIKVSLNTVACKCLGHILFR